MFLAAEKDRPNVRHRIELALIDLERVLNVDFSFAGDYVEDKVDLERMLTCPDYRLRFGIHVGQVTHSMQATCIAIRFYEGVGFLIVI